jgi:hypothetical protein
MSKERLVELLGDLLDLGYSPSYVADYLLANGVIVPPLKIGQKLWDIHYNKPRKWEVVYLGYNGKEWHINIHWWKDRHNFKTLSITYPFVGKMWYFTREEAEKAIEKRGKEI